MPRLRLTVTLPGELLRPLRERTRTEGKTESEVIEDALRKHLGHPESGVAESIDGPRDVA